MGIDQTFYKVTKNYFEAEKAYHNFQNQVSKTKDKIWKIVEEKYGKYFDKWIEKKKNKFLNYKKQKDIKDKVMFDFVSYIMHYYFEHKSKEEVKNYLEWNMFNYFSVYNFNLNEKDKENLINEAIEFIENIKMHEDEEIKKTFQERWKIEIQEEELLNKIKTNRTVIAYLGKCEDIHEIIKKYFPYVKKYGIYILSSNIAKKILKKLENIKTQEDFENTFDIEVYRDYKFDYEIEEFKKILEQIINNKNKKYIFIYEIW